MLQNCKTCATRPILDGWYVTGTNSKWPFLNLDPRDSIWHEDFACNSANDLDSTSFVKTSHWHLYSDFKKRVYSHCTRLPYPLRYQLAKNGQRYWSCIWQIQYQIKLPDFTLLSTSRYGVYSIMRQKFCEGDSSRASIWIKIEFSNIISHHLVPIQWAPLDAEKNMIKILSKNAFYGGENCVGWCEIK